MLSCTLPVSLRNTIQNLRTHIHAFHAVVQITLFIPSPFLSLNPCTHHHSAGRARELSSVAREWAAAKQPSIPHGPRRSRHWGSALLLRFGALFSRLSTAACSPSSSPAPAARSTTPSAETSTCWCRGFESHATPPSRRRRPCPSPLRRCRWKPRLKELPRWRGVPCVGDGLGAVHEGFGLGFEFGAQAQTYAEDRAQGFV